MTKTARAGFRLATIAVTAVACALGALIAGRAGLAAIPLGLALWAFAGFALLLAGASLVHHAHLIDWGIALMAATVAGGRRRAAARRTAMTTGDDADLQLFLVEHDLRGLSPTQLASAHQVLEEAVCRQRAGAAGSGT